MVNNIINRTKKGMVVVMIFSIILPSTILVGQTAQKDYYYEGQAAAEQEYGGGGAMVGGLASGTLLGLIGWGLGYLIVANQGTDVPHHYTSGLDTTQRMQFERGYKDYVKKTRKSKFNMGAGIGTLVAVVLVLGSGE